MTASDDLQLAELLCARLCHDLAGPIGGAAAGAELLSDGETPDAEDVRLLADSIAAAAAQLKFLRAAFGHGSAPFAAGELEGLARLILQGRAALDWSEPARGPVARPLGKIVLVLLLVARDRLARGGEVALRLEPGGATLLARGPASGGDELLAGFDESAGAPGARGAPARYAARLAAAQGWTLRVEEAEALLRVQVELGA